MKSLDDLILQHLKDICYAEAKTLTALSKMMRGAQSPDLKAAFQNPPGAD